MDNKFPNYTEIQQEQSVDIKALYFKFLGYWYLFFITIVLVMLIAFLFNKYTKPVYKVKSTVLITEEKGGLSDAQSLLGFGNITNTQKLQNQIGILKSRSLVSRTVKSLNLNYSCFLEDNFLTSEVYNESPFSIAIDTSQLQPVGSLKFYVTITSPDEYRLEAEGQDLAMYDYRTYKEGDKKLASVKYDKKHRFGEKVTTSDFSFQIDKTAKFDAKTSLNQRYYFVFNSLNSLISEFSGYEIEPINKEASIVEISLKGNNPQKAVDFLNQLTREYIRQGLEKKNQIAINTILFIDGQLMEIRDSLNTNENVLQNFRTSNQIMNLDAQSQQVYTSITELEKEKAVLLVKAKYYSNLKDYIQKNKDDINGVVVPSAMGIDDPVMTQILTQLQELYAEKSERLLGSKPNNPMVLQIDQKIVNTKKALTESINNIVKTSDISIKDIEARIQELSGFFRNLPATQRQLLGIERKYKLNDAIYTYLLQKRSEAAITKASNTPDNEVVDVADPVVQEQVFPKTSLNYTIAFLLGLIIPLLYILGKDYLNDKVVNKNDIEKHTTLPVIGHVLHNKHDSNIVAYTSPKSAISESFRALRTNLQYMTQGKEKFTILITSTSVSEGKTFTSMNLACIYAQFNRKTLLMGYDLRKPKIYQDFGLKNTVGITSYLIGKSSLEEIIQKSPVPNLDIISAGPVPPNPAELIASPMNVKM
ncbi:MAG TPA: GNVR domain-containing protein, partial [Bacteroidales bacterium]|nr:GNVR domain-containing protein [Bacteroidales bacterium]